MAKVDPSAFSLQKLISLCFFLKKKGFTLQEGFFFLRFRAFGRLRD